MNYKEYSFISIVWQFPGMSGWHFLTIPKDISEDITHQFSDKKRGWGSLPVAVKIGNTNWKTSIFPDTKIGAYLLPLKSDLRKNERISADQEVYTTLEILV